MYTPYCVPQRAACAQPAPRREDSGRPESRRRVLEACSIASTPRRRSGVLPFDATLAFNRVYHLPGPLYQVPFRIPPELPEG